MNEIADVREFDEKKKALKSWMIASASNGLTIILGGGRPAGQGRAG